MAKHQVENVAGAYRVAGRRVSLDSIAYRFREGLSPESVAAEGLLLFWAASQAEEWHNRPAWIPL